MVGVRREGTDTRAERGLRIVWERVLAGVLLVWTKLAEEEKSEDVIDILPFDS